MTGLGVVTSLGTDVDTVFDAIVDGRSGHRPLERLADEDLRHRHAAPVSRNAVLSQLADDERSLTWPAALAVVAARAALADADRAVDDAPLFVGTSLGVASALDIPGVPVAEVDLTAPGWFSRYPLCAAVAEAAATLGARGEVVASTATCAAGNYALAHGVDAIRSGRCDWALAGGAEEVTLIPYIVFHQIRAIGSRCRPFDAERDGLLFGEGAAFLVLERASVARARGARIYASVDGVGFSNDAHHLVAPHPEGVGAEQAIRRCLDAAGLAPAQVGYVNAHGTGTPHNDVTESIAIVRALGRGDAPVSSTKGATGHCMGAASAVEAALTVIALHRGLLPPTVGLQHVDPEVQGEILAAAKPLTTPRTALSIGLGFGGNNAVVAFSAPPRVTEVAQRRSVYVDGAGAVLGATLGVRAVLERIVAGHAALDDERATFVAAEILGRKGLRHVDRAALLFAVAMAHDLGEWPTVLPDRAGAVLGSALPGYATIVELLKEYQAQGPRNLNPMRVQFAAPNAASSWWLIRAGITGFSGSVSTGDCSGLDAVRIAAEQVATGRIDAAAAGGVHAAVPEAWTALRGGGALIEGACAVTLRHQSNGAWARIADSAARFDALDPRAALHRAVAAIGAETTVAHWTTQPTKDEALGAVPLGRLGYMRAAGSALAVAAAADSIRTGRCERALATSTSPEGYASAILLEAVNGTSDPR